MTWIDGMTRAQAAHRMENVRTVPKDRKSAIMTEVEYREMLSEYKQQWGPLSVSENEHLAKKVEHIRALARAAEDTKRSAQDAQRQKDAFDAEKKARLDKIAEGKMKTFGERAAAQAERDKASRDRKLLQYIKAGGPIQGIGDMINDYSSYDLSRLVLLSDTPIRRKDGEPDPQYRKRWTDAQKYRKDRPIRDARKAEIARKFYLYKGNPLPTGQERIDLLQEYEDLGGDSGPIRKKLDKIAYHAEEARKKDAVGKALLEEQAEKAKERDAADRALLREASEKWPTSPDPLKKLAESQQVHPAKESGTPSHWIRPKTQREPPSPILIIPSDFKKRRVLDRGSRYVFKSSLRKIVVRIHPDGTGELKQIISHNEPVEFTLSDCDGLFDVELVPLGMLENGAFKHTGELTAADVKVFLAWVNGQ